MTMAKLDISNVITVTLLSALKGLANLNTSVLAMFTADVPIPAGYGTYGVYRSLQGVAQDYGSNSTTYRLANDVFSQQPNILSGGGYLVIIPLLASAAAQPATILATGPVNFLGMTATDYNLNAVVNGAVAADLLIGTLDLTSIATVATSLNSTAITAAGLVFTVDGSLSDATVTLKTTATGASPSADITIGTAGTGTDIAPFINMVGATATGAASGAERIKDAVLRTNGAISYFGIILTALPSDTDLEELAPTIQTMDKLLFIGTSVSGAISGVATTLLNAGYTHTRMLYYSLSAADALDFAACYAGRGLSIDFSGSNTAHTMHLKDLIGLVADSGMTQTLLTQAMNAGVDTYPDFGIPKTFTSGANLFFDQVYTREAFKTQLQIAGFNYLAQTNTKIPQTEQGMSGLKSALRQICSTFVQNGVFAPGTWTEPTTFGNPADHIQNIAAVGYYIYSDPIATQPVADRNARVAPAIYIAAKDSGAIHSSSVLVYVEA